MYVACLGGLTTLLQGGVQPTASSRVPKARMGSKQRMNRSLLLFLEGPRVVTRGRGLFPTENSQDFLLYGRHLVVGQSRVHYFILRTCPSVPQPKNFVAIFRAG